MSLGLAPVRCNTCNKVIGSIAEEFWREKNARSSSLEDVFQKLGITRPCCKSALMAWPGPTHTPTPPTNELALEPAAASSTSTRVASNTPTTTGTEPPARTTGRGRVASPPEPASTPSTSAPTKSIKINRPPYPYTLVVRTAEGGTRSFRVTSDKDLKEVEEFEKKRDEMMNKRW